MDNILSPELGHTEIQEIDGRTIVSNSAPWWVLMDDHQVLCRTYRYEEEVAVSEMVEFLINDTGEGFLKLVDLGVYETPEEALAAWSEIQPTYRVCKCGSKYSFEIPTTEILRYL